SEPDHGKDDPGDRWNPEDQRDERARKADGGRRITCNDTRGDANKGGKCKAFQSASRRDSGRLPVRLLRSQLYYGLRCRKWRRQNERAIGLVADLPDNTEQKDCGKAAPGGPD